MTERDGGLGPHRHPVFGFRPDPRHVAAAEEVLRDEGQGRSVGGYLEACLRWLAEDPRTALAAAAPWWPARVLHERLAAVLRRKIDDGEMSGHLPSTVALAAAYGAGRATVTRALAILERDGVITSSGGRADGRRGYDVAVRSKRRRAHPATAHPATSAPSKNAGAETAVSAVPGGSAPGQEVAPASTAPPAASG
jgi:hypothetical protein